MGSSYYAGTHVGKEHRHAIGRKYSDGNARNVGHQCVKSVKALLSVVGVALQDAVVDDGHVGAMHLTRSQQVVVGDAEAVAKLGAALSDVLRGVARIVAAIEA